MKTIIFILCLIVLTISSIALGHLATDDISSFITDIRLGDIVAPEDCVNLTMRKTAYCLNNYIKEIFKYEETPDSKTLTLEELKESGGDCLNWAELYVGYIEDLGFESKMPIIKTRNRTAHTFAVISDETGYCILDQTSVKCFSLGD